MKRIISLKSLKSVIEKRHYNQLIIIINAMLSIKREKGSGDTYTPQFFYYSIYLCLR